jgi:MFS family permease
MVQKINKFKLLSRRLLPLYAAAFLQGFVLWYAIEKLFMHSIGFNDAGIGFMVAAYSVLMLLLETPSGILADRWSRKGILVIASICLAVSSFIGGISTEPALYIISALLWGAFYALQSGTYESVVYDTLYEETGKSEGFERYVGRHQIVESSALVAGSLLGGVVSQMAGMQATYFLTIPISLAAIVALVCFKEPQLHKAEPHGSVMQQVKETFKAVIVRGLVMRLAFVTLLVTITLQLLYEFSQLWIIAVGTPTSLFGPAFAVVLAATGVGGWLAGRIGKKHRRVAMATTFAAMVVSAFALVIPTPLVVIIAAQFALGVSGIALSVMVSHDLHDLLPSKVRAGAASAIATASRIALIPGALLFGFISTHYGTFNAAWMLVVLTILAGAGELRQWLGSRE